MSQHKKTVLAFVMAGGEGRRLSPLTAHRCKPSVPFNGRHRLVDFVLSNLVNSEIFAIYLLVQYKSQALIEHVRQAWTMAPFLQGHFITVVPPQMRVDRNWFQGTADAVYQNLHLIETHKPDLIVVFGADHIYRFDVRQMIEMHLARSADVSVATVPVPLRAIASFGIVDVDSEMWIRGFQEKPARADALADRPGHALASMGNYVFSADVLVEELRRAASLGESDFGTHLLPRLVATRRVLAYDFSTNLVPGVGDFEDPNYWRDVGTIDAYFDAHFDTLGPRPAFRIANAAWPIYASPDPFESALVDSGDIKRSVIGTGCSVHNARLDHAMLRRTVSVEEGAQLDHCIVMDGTVIGAGARIERTIIDEDNHIPPGEQIGGNTERDRRRFQVSENGIVVVPRGYFPRPAEPAQTSTQATQAGHAASNFMPVSERPL